MTALEPETLEAQIARFAVRCVTLGSDCLGFRQSGNPALAPTHVLLHGIGSGSASWVRQLTQARFAKTLNLLAWDAPGYGSSSALPSNMPSAGHYSERLWQWLDQMGTNQPVVLVGHSLGCLIAAHAARTQPDRIRQLILLSPAQGYGRATPSERDKKLNDRLATLASLGPEGMAQKRGRAMLSPDASDEQVRFVQQVMAQAIPHGYSQAARLLAFGDLLGDLAHVRCPLTVASGSADVITPPDGCQAVAANAQAPYVSLGAVGHVCALEAAGAVSALLGITDAQ